ncbi:MAG TPA: alkaline phosphatase D family protein [bacterium]
MLYENYRDRYDPFFPMAEMLKVTPVDFVWDDHDWVNNNCDGTYMNEGGANSIAIYQKAFPHYPLPSASNGIWHKFTCGNIDVFMVDNRVQRDPNLNALYWHPSLNRFVFVANSMDKHSILGDEQMNWLLDELKNSKATWKFISSGTPFNPAVRGLIELALLLQGTAYDPIPDPATGSPMSMAFLAEEFSDKWAGFPSDIYKLLSGIITNDIKNVIFLSGDTHNSGIDDGANSILPELMGGPLDRTNQQVVAMSKALFKIDIWNKGGHTYDNAIPPDLGNAYGKVSVFGADSVKLEVVSEAGKTLAAHSVKAGFLPRSVAGIVVPGAIDFGTIMSDKMGGSAVVVIATSIDTFKISDIVVTPIKGKSIIVPTVKTVKLASGATKIIEFGFIPQLPEGVKIDTTLVKITFQCNDVMGEKAIYAQGVAQLTGVETADQPSIPADYNLYSCYPNPFNASTTIRFAVPKLSQVEIVVYNSLGQVVKRLAKGDYPAGNHRLEWNGSNDLNELVGSGLYFILFKTEEFQQINKTLFLK